MEEISLKGILCFFQSIFVLLLFVHFDFSFGIQAQQFICTYMCVCVYEERMRRVQASHSTQSFPADTTFALQGHWEGNKGSMESSHWCSDAGQWGSKGGDQPEQLPRWEEQAEQHMCAARGWGLKLSCSSWR